ncbi:MAG: hypothetical protein NDI84_08025 [Steroidobacteraceae bacterium]|nr:hypothetical protein [Steroidobacteraceae bacterium]
MGSFAINVKNDFAGVANNLARDIRRKVEIVQQRVVIEVAKEVKAAEVRAMESTFFQPTPFTTNALTVKMDRQRMEARVEVKDGYWSRADNYLDTQIMGRSARTQKAFERALQRAGLLPTGWVAVPGQGARMDRFGNMSVGQIKQILAWFDAAEPYRGSTQNMGQKGRDKKRKGTRKKRGFEYFYAAPGHRIGRRSWMHGRSQNLQPGIYERTLHAFGASIRPVLIFVRSAGYQKRFQFYEVAQQTVDQVADRIVNEAIAKEFGR